MNDCRSVDESNLEESKSAGSDKEKKKTNNKPKKSHFQGKVTRANRSQSIRLKDHGVKLILKRMDTNFNLDEEASPLKGFIKNKTNH